MSRLIYIRTTVSISTGLNSSLGTFAQHPEMGLLETLQIPNEIPCCHYKKPYSAVKLICKFLAIKSYN